MVAAHHRMVAQEQREYYWKRDVAVLEPTSFLSIIVYGADQSACSLPHSLKKNEKQKRKEAGGQIGRGYSPRMS